MYLMWLNKFTIENLLNKQHQAQSCRNVLGILNYVHFLYHFQIIKVRCQYFSTLTIYLEKRTITSEMW